MVRDRSIYFSWIMIGTILVLVMISLFLNTEFDHSARWLPVFSQGNILGTDGAGRDMLNVLIVSMRNNIILGMMAAVVSLVSGATFGILLGYIFHEGPLKRALVFFARMIKSVPLLMWIFLVVFWLELLDQSISLFNSEMIKMLWIFAIFGGIYSFNLALLLMGHIQKLKASQFIEACEFIGLKKTTIIFKHIIWHHSKSLFGSQASYIFAQCVLLELTLSYNAIAYGYSSNSLSIGRLFDRAVLEKPMSEHMFMPLIAALLLTLTFSYLSQNFEKRFQK